MSDRLFALHIFSRVARLGSFSAAARELRLPQSSTSRTVAELEREIGAVLLVRTTRAVTLTDVGREFLERVEHILADLDAAEQAARGSGEFRGVLRVGAGTSFGVREIIPRLPTFAARHPALRIELLLEDGRQDLVTQGVDVAFRFGTIPDSTATARKILRWPRVVVASNDYLKMAGAPQSPSEFADHAIILGPGSVGGHWSFRHEGTVTSFQVAGQTVVTGSEGAIAAAVAGLGILMAPVGACRRELDSGELVRLLPKWDAGFVELNAVFPAGRAAKAAARAFVDHVVAAVAGPQTSQASPRHEEVEARERPASLL